MLEIKLNMLEIKLGEPQKHETVTLYPVLASEKLELSYTLLGDALEAGSLQVTEVGDGTVPELSVENRGDADVLILDGEQLIGAKQNRMTNRSIVLGANTKTTIPVSCMEQGRWRFDSRSFRHGDHYSPSKVRRHARKLEARAARAGAAADHRVLAGAQGDVWDEIDGYAQSLDARSPTGKLDHVYDLRSKDLEGWSKHFTWVDDQVGLLVVVGDEVLGLDLIGDHRLYARLHKRLVSGYIMDAMAARRRAAEEVGVAVAEEFLGKVRAATRSEAPTVGKGTYWVLSGGVMGGELEEDDRAVHLSAFPAEEERERQERPIRSPRYRGRRRL